MPVRLTTNDACYTINTNSSNWVTTTDYYLDNISDMTAKGIRDEFQKKADRAEKVQKDYELYEKQRRNKEFRCLIKDVYFNKKKKTVAIRWSDGSRSVVKCQKGDKWDPEKGMLACIAKKMFGNTSLFNEILQEYLPEA